MIYVGIDVAKNKHDCTILGSNGEVLQKNFTFPNTRDGFDYLYRIIRSHTKNLKKVVIGLEATGHYNGNLLGYLVEKNLPTNQLNPLHVNQFRKSLSLRKTKTDKIDSKVIAMMLMSGIHLKPYTKQLYHMEELKSLTRHRYDLVEKRAKLKVSIDRLVNILFPELERFIPNLNGEAVYQMLSEFPGATHIAGAHITRLTNILHRASKGYHNRKTAEDIRNAAKHSIASIKPAKSFELKQTIGLIQHYTRLINEADKEIKIIMDQIDSPIMTIPGISYTIGAMIIAEIGDFSNFVSPDKLLAFSGFSPSTYQSGEFQSNHATMEKRGSTYLRYALFNSTRLVCQWDQNFGAYLAKKRAEGKHYKVAISHAAKRLIRLIFAMEKSGKAYCPAY